MSNPNSIIKADRATIKLGDIDLDVLQFPDGSYHFFINQLNEVLSIKASNSTGKKYLQPLINKDPNRVNRARVDGIKSNLKTLSIDLVSEAVQIYAQLGNPKCIAIAIACLSEALERRADNAFNVKRTEEERNSRSAERLNHASQYHPVYTTWIQKDGAIHGWQYAQAINALKDACGLPLIPIDQYSCLQLSVLNQCERVYDSLRHMGFCHLDCLTQIYIQNQKLGLVA